MKKIINFLKRFNWQEAKNVKAETLTNLIVTFLCYSIALACVIALFFGVWYQLFLIVLMYFIGTMCLVDAQGENESALNYLYRVFEK